MSTNQIVFAMLRAFARQNKIHTIIFTNFISMVHKYMQKDETGKYDVFSTNTNDIIISSLLSLEEEEKCKIEYTDGKVSEIYFPYYFNDVIKKESAEIDKNPEISFPCEDALRLKIPANLITVIDVKNSLVNYLKQDEMNKLNIVRLTFPGNIKSIITLGDIAEKKILYQSLNKLKMYLNAKNNSNYVYHKLLAVCGNKESIISDMLNKIKTNPGWAITSISNPTNFSFNFWAQLSSFIVQEYLKIDAAYTNKNSICQSAYLIGMFNLHFKEVLQLEKDRETAFKNLDEQLRQKPYVFTISDIYNLKDTKGLLLNKYSKENLHNFIKSKIETQKENLLPEIIRLRTVDHKEYYICKEIILPLTIKKITDAKDYYKGLYLEKWIKALKEYKKFKEMYDDILFLENLEKQIKNSDPLLYSLLNYDLLYLSMKDTKTGTNIGIEISNILDKKNNILYPLSEILELRRKELLTEARKTLPLLETLPFIGKLIIAFKRFLKRLKHVSKTEELNTTKKQGASEFIVKKKTKTLQNEFSTNKSNSTGISRQQQLLDYRKMIYKLKEHFVGGNVKIETRMEELAEKWNPLYDPLAKKNLVEDINCLVRDYIRTLKRGFRSKPPGVSRIKDMAELLSRNTAFDKIKKTEYFKQYIEIYIIKLLSDK